MSDAHPPKPPPKKKRRPYEKPDFLPSLAFERTSLACAGVKNTAGFPVGNCSMQS
ncbi:MAG: hypothetical protein KC620_00260 [Myxococcales bacterium]|nr:hypothetical protein [Myxococcales bacterium]